jgi:hypothetical protein
MGPPSYMRSVVDRNLYLTSRMSISPYVLKLGRWFVESTAIRVWTAWRLTHTAAFHAEVLVSTVHAVGLMVILLASNDRKPVPVVARSKAWICGRSTAGVVGSNTTGSMNDCCECCVLSGRGLCDKLITRPEESYRVRCVAVCDLETSWMRRHWPTWGGGGRVTKITQWIWQQTVVAHFRHYPGIFVQGVGEKARHLVTQITQ